MTLTCPPREHTHTKTKGKETAKTIFYGRQRGRSMLMTEPSRPSACLPSPPKRANVAEGNGSLFQPILLAGGQQLMNGAVGTPFVERHNFRES